MRGAAAALQPQPSSTPAACQGSHCRLPLCARGSPATLRPPPTLQSFRLTLIAHPAPHAPSQPHCTGMCMVVVAFAVMISIVHSLVKHILQRSDEQAVMAAGSAEGGEPHDAPLP